MPGKKAITTERLTDDMELELLELFPRHGDLRLEALRLLMHIEESGPQKKSELAERRDTYKKTGRSPSYYKQKRSLVEKKLNNPYLPEVHSQVLQDVALRLQRTFDNFFEEIKEGREAGYPRFKGRNRYDSFTYPQYGNGAILKDGRLVLSKIGVVRIFQHRPMAPNGTVKTCTIRRDVDKWYACFRDGWHGEVARSSRKPSWRRS